MICFSGVAQHLVEAGLEVEQLGGAVEARHHRLERILLGEEAVLVGPDDRVGREQQVGGHCDRYLGRRRPA